MNTDEIYQQIQGIIRDSLVFLIGSGLSVAEGIPGMGGLTKKLISDLPKHLPAGTTGWDEIARALASGGDLESVLLRYPPTAEIEALILDVTSEFIAGAETRVLTDIFTSGRELRLTRLLRRLPRSNRAIPIITTNYDRLAEVAAEMAGFGVDTGFCGHYAARFDEQASKLSHAERLVQPRGRDARIQYRPRVSILKPHGSLDWYLVNDEPIQSPLDIAGTKLLITPGRNKFRSGYERPFDRHREVANSYIDRAEAFLIVGYGFNDDHLQVHLEDAFRRGKPALILTQSLSSNTTNVLRQHLSVSAIHACTTITGPGFARTHGTTTTRHSGKNLWDLGVLLEEVFSS